MRIIEGLSSSNRIIRGIPAYCVRIPSSLEGVRAFWIKFLPDTPKIRENFSYVMMVEVRYFFQKDYLFHMGVYVERRWAHIAENVLKEVGIKSDQIVLDFGCGSGNYSIPIAKIVGERGRVYALDKDRWRLDKLMDRTESAGLKNIECIKTSGGLKLPLEDASVDVILFYDVLHSYYFTQAERKKLLEEANRISKPNAIISIYPKHMEPKELKKELENANFYLEKKYHKTLLVHDDNFEEGMILNFRKKRYSIREATL